MNVLSPDLILPKIEFEFIKEENKTKVFRVVSEKLDPIFLKLLEEKKIRVQIWLEREVRKKSAKRVKRSWVHSQDFSNLAPLKLFDETQYDYGGGDGWGWKNPLPIPTYSTTNGIVPTEYEITFESIVNNRILIKIPIVNIFSNIIKTEYNRPPVGGENPKDLYIIGRGKRKYQLLRMKLAINYNGRMVTGTPSNCLMLGIHQDKTLFFDITNIESLIRVGKFI